MKFQELAYERPKLEIIEREYIDLLEQFENAQTFEAQNVVFSKINAQRAAFDTMRNIAQIRHTVNTKDKFYEEENNYFDEASPRFMDLESRFFKAILDSKFRSELEAKWGKQLFVIGELSLKTFEPVILKQLQDENKTASKYVKLKATAEIDYNGKTYNLSSIVPFTSDPDQKVRKETNTLKWDFFKKNRKKVETIYDDLVKLRHNMAKELGYKNFVELGYARMLRSDYTPEMVSKFRKQVEEYIVPLCTKLKERQTKRLGLEKLAYYDEGFFFKSGNPNPKGSPDWIVDNAKTMYTELSPETDEFFNFMVDNNMMDLVAKEGKATGGYCTFINDYKAPFIFSNFNGTSHDIDVLTHEAGHAFQVYESREIGIPDYNWPTYEACEIHSMSMEFFTWPWMKLFFKEDEEKYKFAHLGGALQFLPYGVAVDEFQHIVYENPEMTPAERHQAWRGLEKRYLPHRNYDGNSFLEEGTSWMIQNHIFESPFYYIDYTLAQICAFQFWVRYQNKDANAWNDYVRLCKAGGSKSFLDLVDLANLRSPFDPECVKSVIGDIGAWLDGVDDSKF